MLHKDVEGRLTLRELIRNEWVSGDTRQNRSLHFSKKISLKFILASSSFSKKNLIFSDSYSSPQRLGRDKRKNTLNIASTTLSPNLEGKLKRMVHSFRVRVAQNAFLTEDRFFWIRESLICWIDRAKERVHKNKLAQIKRSSEQTPLKKRNSIESSSESEYSSESTDPGLLLVEINNQDEDLSKDITVPSPLPPPILGIKVFAPGKMDEEIERD